MQAISSNILIRSTLITHGEVVDEYEFILDYKLSIREWTKLKIGQLQTFYTIHNSRMELEGMLFELNHVRVNPMLDNTRMIAKLTDALAEIGVKISNQPENSSMAICYKPMGEIRDNVRFYLNKEGKLVFLSPITRPRLVYSKPKS